MDVLLSLTCPRLQLSLMPPDSSSEFSFSRKGQLIMSAVSASSRPGSASLLSNGSAPPTQQAPPTQEHLQKWILAAAKVGGATNTNTPARGPGTEGVCVCVQGRDTELVQLTRPVSGGLGFSVVGLSGGSQGVFVKQVQPGGVAYRLVSALRCFHVLFQRLTCVQLWRSGTAVCRSGTRSWSSTAWPWRRA